MQPAAAADRPVLQIEQVVWGFDGRIIAHRFNPVSILLSNPSPNEVDVTLRLKKLMGGYRPVDAVIERPFFISPYSSKWVQFYPYCMENWEEWSLSWGDRKQDRADLPKPRPGEPALVVLERTDAFAVSGGSVKRFPDELFPPLTTVTDGLAGVFLDHAPRWEASRREAFLDWLSAGGTVHLLYDGNGRYPRFPESLAMLNVSEDRTLVGSGLILRHPRSKRELDPDFVKDLARPVDPDERLPLSGRFAGANALGMPLGQEDVSAPASIYADLQGEVLATHDAVLFAGLKSITRPHRNWPLIYLMSFAYLLLLFPGCYWLGQAQRDHRIALLVLVGTILVFSIAFLAVGRHSHGDASKIRSVALAQQIAGSEFVVTQWTDAAVANGGVYTFRHEGADRVYSTCQEIEDINGRIINGSQGLFEVDIPPYSSQTFSHRTKLDLPPLGARITDLFTLNGELRSLTIQTGDSFPDRPQRIMALYRNQIYEVTEQSGALRTKSRGVPLVALLTALNFSRLQFFFDPEFDKYQSPDEAFKTLSQPLLLRSFGLRTGTDFAQFSLPEDRLRLFVYAPMPEAFFADAGAFDSQSGFVLYQLDLPTPEATGSR